MNKFLTIAASTIALAVAAPALAQEAAPQASKAPPAPESTSPMTAPPSTSASAPSGSAVDASASMATLAVGTSVKDNTGATIGQITQLKPDASGKNVATIKMGDKTFAVDATNLAVQDGAAVVNASQADLEKMIQDTKPKS